MAVDDIRSRAHFLQAGDDWDPLFLQLVRDHTNFFRVDDRLVPSASQL
jgi:hypothetical protein